MKMSPERQREYRTVILAGLLHDIGKYLQRGEFGGRVAGQHPQVGANFVSLWKSDFSHSVDADLLQTLVQRHHESHSFPDSLQVDAIQDEHTRTLARLVSRADNLASSERAERATGFRDFRTTALTPVFHRVRLLRDSAPAASHLPHAEVADLSTEPAIFPEPGRQTTGERVTSHIRAFGTAFGRLREQLNWNDFDCVYSHFLSLLGRFAGCIASDTQSEPPDISLYDHLRLTSAVAACLYQYHASTGTLADEAVRRPESHRCALVVGDLSGIQEYLFDVATVGAGGVARRLRARSFFLQMLADACAYEVLGAFGLPLANVIMASGGKFYVLVPNLSDTGNDVLDRLRADCDGWLLENFHGALAVNLAWTPLADNDFGTGERGDGFGSALARLHGALAQRKQRRLERVLIHGGSWHESAFARSPFPAESGVCRVCGHFPRERASEGGEVDVCQKCYQDVKLGRCLPSAQYVGFYDRPLASGTPCFKTTFFAAADVGGLPAGAALVTRLNDADLTPLARGPATFRFLTNHVPREPDGAVWTFEDIAARRKLGEGAARSGLLAIIKADVDYLGQVFQDGLRRDQPPSYDTPSRVAALSRHLDSFFSAWLEWLLSREFPQVYAVYSGGDDLLLVGPRAQALPLVGRLQKDFARYTENPELTLSAGVTLVKPRLPLARAVEFADESLEKAKNAGRDRLCILDHVVGWGDLPLVDDGIELFERNRPPTALLYSLKFFAGLWQEWKAGRNARALRFQPLLAYSIRRNLEPGSELYTWLGRLVGFPVGACECPEAKLMDYLSVIVQWALLGRREVQSD
jgi:CRISPR-associated protein Csm1